MRILFMKSVRNWFNASSHQRAHSGFMKLRPLGGVALTLMAAGFAGQVSAQASVNALIDQFCPGDRKGSTPFPRTVELRH